MRTQVEPARGSLARCWHFRREAVAGMLAMRWARWSPSDALTHAVRRLFDGRVALHTR